MNKRENFFKGIIKENPVFVSLLGMCPVLGVTTSLMNALGMGVAFTLVLLMSNVIVSLIRKFIPDEVRIPSYIVVIATLVTIVELIMQAFTADLYDQLGIFIPLIVVNCVILGRAEAFASKNKVADSAIDALGMGVGYTMAISILSAIRELLGSGELLGFDVTPFNLMQPASIFIMAPGAFLTLGVILAVINGISAKRTSKKASVNK
jgi:Na+-translocating ferredoxin:NAD+ oxidoreductase subunit E